MPDALPQPARRRAVAIFLFPFEGALGYPARLLHAVPVAPESRAMIDFQQVSKSFAGQDILVDASFRINDGERVGIVGPNGTGKTTVFSMVVDELSPDKGTITIPAGVRLGYVRQQLEAHDVEGSVLHYVESGPGEMAELHAEIETLEHGLEDADARARDATLKRIGVLQSRLEDLGAYDVRSRAQAAATQPTR